MNLRILWWPLLLLAGSCSTATLLTAVESDVQKAAATVPSPVIVPAGGSYRLNSDLPGVSVGPGGSGLRLFYTFDGTNPAFNQAGNPDWTHTSRNDSGTASWGPGAWTSGAGAFPLKAQYLTTDGRRSSVAQAVFRVVGHVGVESAVTNPAPISAVALSSTGLSAEAASGPAAKILVRDAGQNVVWSQVLSGAGTVNIKGMAFDGSGRLWVCGNVQGAGTYTVGPGPVAFTATTSTQVGFLTTLDAGGVCQGVVFEDSRTLNSSFEALAVSDPHSAVYVAGQMDRTPGPANDQFRRIDATGTDLGALIGPAPVNSTVNAAALKFGFSRDYQASLQNDLISGGASDGFTAVDYDPASDVVAFGGWGIGPQFRYNGSTTLSGIGTVYRVPVVIAASGTLVYQWGTIGRRTAGAGVDAKVDAVAVLPGGAVVAAGSQAPNDGTGWTWVDASVGTVIVPTDASTGFWVRIAAGLATAGRQISSPGGVTVTGVTVSRSTGSIYTSFTLGAGTPSGWAGALAASGTPSPWIVMTDPTLGGVGWTRSGGLGPGSAGPLTHGPVAAVDRLFTAWTAAGTPAMDLGEGLTAPATSGSLLLRLFD